MTTPNHTPNQLPSNSASGEGVVVMAEGLAGLHFSWATVSAEKQGMPGRKSEDSMVANPDAGTFVVCDGADGSNAGAVSEAAATHIAETTCEQTSFKTEDEAMAWMSEVLLGAPKAIRAVEINDEVYEERRQLEEEDGVTTAAAVKLCAIAGKPYALIGNVGDSGVFLRRADGAVKRLTTEQCDPKRPNVVTNSLRAQEIDDPGFAPRPLPGQDQKTYSEKLTKNEVIVLRLGLGDTLAIASDGIWGDTVDQKLSPEKVGTCLAALAVSDAAANLLGASRKNDDKALIVVRIDTVAEAGSLPVAVAQLGGMALNTRGGKG